MLAGELDEAGDRLLEPADALHPQAGALVRERALRDAPPAVELADEVLAAARSTSVKNTSANPALPVMWRSGRMSMPGVSMSRMSSEMPLCFGSVGSVRT